MTQETNIQILVATDDGLHLLGSRTPPQLAGHEIRGLSVLDGEWWAIVDRQHIHHRVHGTRWKRVASLNGAQGLCLQPTPSAVYVGTSEAHLYRLEGDDLHPVETFEHFRGRDRWYTPWGGPPDTRSMSNSLDGTLYVNVHVGGILRSRDGRTWRSIVDIDCDAHQVLAHPDRPRHLFAATAIGLGVSKDAGGTWAFETAGLHAHYQRAVAVTNDRVLVSTSHNERGRQAAVYWRPLKGDRPLVKCEVGLPKWFDDNVNTFCLAGAGTCAAIGTSDGSVFFSEDQGDHWQTLVEGLPPVRGVVIHQD